MGCLPFLSKTCFLSSNQGEITKNVTFHHFSRINILSSENQGKISLFPQMTSLKENCYSQNSILTLIPVKWIFYPPYQDSNLLYYKIIMACITLIGVRWTLFFFIKLQLAKHVIYLLRGGNWDKVVSPLPLAVDFNHYDKQFYWLNNG